MTELINTGQVSCPTQEVPMSELKNTGRLPETEVPMSRSVREVCFSMAQSTGSNFQMFNDLIRAMPPKAD